MCAYRGAMIGVFSSFAMILLSKDDVNRVSAKEITISMAIIFSACSFAGGFFGDFYTLISEKNIMPHLYNLWKRVSFIRRRIGRKSQISAIILGLLVIWFEGQIANGMSALFSYVSRENLKEMIFFVRGCVHTS
jgi:hypothetical protein